MKTKRKWIDLDYTSPTSLRAEDIPYDATTSVRDAILNLSITGIQGPQGPTGISGGPQGVTGFQGPQGITGLGDLQPGATGIRGVTGFQGVTGLIGFQGATGFYGQTGVQGVTGFVFPSPIPSSYVILPSLYDATSSSWADIPGLSTSILLDSASQIFSTMSFETESSGAGSYPTGAYRIVIVPGPSGPESDGTSLEKFLSPDEVSIGSVTHYDGPFPSASYIVKGQVRRVSGLQKVRVNNAQLFVESLRGGKGDLGQTGIQGVTGWGIQGNTGIAGQTGIAGRTGIQGPTGVQGQTGMGVQGSTGIQGLTGIQGFQGITGIAFLTTPNSNFVYFDSTHQLYDNTSTWVDIAGLSTNFVVDTSGAYVYSTMALESDSTSTPAGLGYYVTGAFRVVISDQTSMVFERFVQDDDDLEISTIPFRTAAMADGTYTIKGQVKVIPKVDATFSYGDKYLGIRKGQLYVQALEGAVGPDGLMGPRGYDGATGIQGITGLGHTGIQGQTGLVGATGVGLGVTGLRGPTGIQGVTGVGPQGSTGLALGVTGLRGPTGIQGVTGIGPQGVTGMALGATGLGGQTGIQGLGAATPYFFNPISRYQVSADSSAEVWAVSSSTVFHDLVWDRTGTAMNIYRNAHGHAIGNRVIIRNTNKDYQVALIDTTTMNSFAVTTTATDGTYGNAGAYSLGFTYAHDSHPANSGTLYAPQGDRTDCQLMSMRIRTGARPSTTYSLIVPASAVNGAGSNTDLSDCYVPDFNVRWDSDTLAAVAATMITNVSGSYSTFQFGNLGSGSLSRMILVHF